MGDRRMSILDRIKEAFGDPDVALEARPVPGPGAVEAGEAAVLAGVVALALHRERGAFRSWGPALQVAAPIGPDEWAASGRLVQVHRAPRRDPWSR